MIKILFLMLLFGWTSSITNDQIAIFKEANLTYGRGNYEHAIELYTAIYNNGFESAELYYNLGHAHYNMEHIGKAILYFEKALKLDAHHSESKLALEQVENEVKIQITEIPDFILLRWYRGIVNSFDSNTWVLIQLICMVFFLVLIYYAWFRVESHVPKWYLASILMLIISISSVVFAMEKYQLESGRNAAIVLGDESTFLYQAADDRSKVITNLGEGVKVYILDQIGNWFKVELKDKDIGWVEKQKVEII